MRTLLIRTIALGTALLSCTGTLAAPPAISAGNAHAITVDASGSVRTWGSDAYGQLGLGRALVNRVPAPVQGVPLLADVSSYRDSALALAVDGSVWSWGENGGGQLGDGTTTSRSVPARVGGLPAVMAVSSGELFSLALARDGAVWSWGINWNGELGNGSFANSLVPSRIDGLADVVAVSAGSQHALALKRDGTVWSWGINSSGQLGDGTTGNRAAPAQVAGLTNVVAISAGNNHSVVVRSDGTVWAWGKNDGGQLGDGTTISRRVPVQAVGLTGMTAVSAGDVNTVALRGDGTVWTWGADAGWCCGVLGDPASPSRSVGAPVPGLFSIVKVSLGSGSHVAAVDGAGHLHAWGLNVWGQLGDGSLDFTKTSPVAISLPFLVGSVAAGYGHTIVIGTGGQAWAWGRNISGQLGDAIPTSRPTPTRVGGITDAIAAAAGDQHSVVLRADGTLLTWGSNDFNAIGGDGPSRSTPGLLAGLSDVIAIAAGGAHNLALKRDRTVAAWGLGWSGQLGNGTYDSSATPLTVPGLANVIAISTHGDHSVALTSDHRVWTWGKNDHGQLGDGSRNNRSLAAPVAGLSDVIAISAGTWHTLALRSDGSVWGWGANDYKQLADNSGGDRLLPGPIAGLANVAAISAGGVHSLAILADGSMRAWSFNVNGALGDGTVAFGDRIATVAGFTGATMVSAGSGYQGFSTAMKADGTVWAWGSNESGQLGDGTFAVRAAPVVAVREGGAGSILGSDWFLDLNPGIAKSIPADKIPAFLVVVSATSAIVADVRFRAQDVGKAIHVFAYAPASLVRVTKDGPVSCVLAQLTPGGTLQQTTAANLQSYVSNVTSTQQQAVTVLNNVPNAQLAGATFCVGAGATGTQSVSAGNNVCVATVPDPSGNPVCVPPASSSTVSVSYEGLWLKGDESGWGVNVTHQGTTLFATWFTYDTDGSDMWLVASSVSQTSAGNFSGTLFRTVGPAFSASPFNSISFPANYTQVGTLTFAFADPNNGTMSYTVNGVTQTKPITRFIYATGGTNCTLGGAQGASPNYQDLWLRSSTGTTEAGWGVNVTHQGDILFATWFTYLPGSSSTNKGMWLVMSNGNKTAPGVYTGALQTTRGPAFNAVPFNPNNVVRSTVGNATFTFTDANNGTFSYTVNGVAQSKPIARYIYASPATVCQ